MPHTVTQPISDKAAEAVEKAEQWASAWAKMAALLGEHAYLAERSGTINGHYILCYISQEIDAVPFIERAIADAVAFGGVVEEYHGNSYAGVQINFGPTYLQVYAETARVFAQQVVGQIDDVRFAPLFSIPSQDGEGEK